MSAVKETLIKKIKQMSEEEAREVWEITRQLPRKKRTSALLARIAQNPTFIIPEKGFAGFAKIKPAKGKGRPASEMIMAERR